MSDSQCWATFTCNHYMKSPFSHREMNMNGGWEVLMWWEFSVSCTMIWPLSASLPLL